VRDLSAELGKPIELVSADHQNKPNNGASIARQWYTRDGVTAIVDVPTSSVALAVEGVSKDQKKLFFVTGAGASDITGKNCSPYAAHWVYDTYALAHGTGSAIVKEGGKTWFFLTADYAFGHDLERDTAEVVNASGGKVLGQALVPLNTADIIVAAVQQSGGRLRYAAFKPLPCGDPYFASIGYLLKTPDGGTRSVREFIKARLTRPAY